MNGRVALDVEPRQLTNLDNNVRTERAGSDSEGEFARFSSIRKTEVL